MQRHDGIQISRTRQCCEPGDTCIADSTPALFFFLFPLFATNTTSQNPSSHITVPFGTSVTAPDRLISLANTEPGRPVDCLSPSVTETHDSRSSTQSQTSQPRNKKQISTHIALGYILPKHNGYQPSGNLSRQSTFIWRRPAGIDPRSW